MKTTTAQSYRVLLADDQADIRDSLRLLLKTEGYETQGVAAPTKAINAIEAREFDAVLMDLNYARDTTSGQEGLDLLTRIQVLDSTVPVVVMTAWSSIELAVEAMRRGARDFIAKPWENNRLLSILRTQIDLRQALRQASRLEAENRLLRVLETGDLERVGSSTTRRVNVRVLAATNADVNAEAAAGRFRQDLLFRLNTIEIHIPPLRDRREDVDLLAHHFLHGYSQRYRKNISSFDTAAIKALHEHPWPGNVRELDHAVERGVLLSPGPSVRAADLGLRAQAAGGAAKLEEMSLDEVERYLIQRTLSRHEGNVSQAAKALGLSRSAMYRRLQKHGLE